MAYEPGSTMQFIYPNYSGDGIYGESCRDYAERSGQLVRIIREIADAFEDGDGNNCRGY